MKRKLLGVILIIIGFCLVIFIAYIFFFRGSKTTEVIPTESEIATTSLPAAVEAEIKPATPLTITSTKKSITGEELKKTGASFAERFGSFSNQSNYENITDLKLFMTESMKAWADNFVTKAQKEYSGIYYGVSTKAISEEVKSFNDDLGTAEILVKTQRRESSGQMSNETVFYQNLLISYKKENGAWKVDRAEWQSKI